MWLKLIKILECENSGCQLFSLFIFCSREVIRGSLDPINNNDNKTKLQSPKLSSRPVFKEHVLCQIYFICSSMKNLSQAQFESISNTELFVDILIWKLYDHYYNNVYESFNLTNCNDNMLTRLSRKIS